MPITNIDSRLNMPTVDSHVFTAFDMHTFSTNYRMQSPTQPDHKDLVHLLLSIAAIALLSALNAHGLKVPRFAFAALASMTALLTFALICKLIAQGMQKDNYFQLVPNAMVLFVFAIALIRLSTSGFDEDDEIYSWNMWAIQHFMGQPADFKFTGAPYPQFFSYWIAGLYQTLGGYVLQSLPRAFLSLPILFMGTVLAVVMPARDWKSSIFSATVIFFTLAPVIAWMSRGLADPLMAGAMLVSALALHRYHQEPEHLPTLVYALVAAVISSLTKQAGIFWACASLPVIVIWGVYKWKWPRMGLIYCAVAIICALVWPLLIAPTFTNNQGVISASTEGRSVAQQMLHSFTEYILIRPYFIAVYGVVIWAAFRNRFVRLVAIVAVLPMLLLWFQFGAYSLRLGIHVIGLAGMLAIIGYYEYFGIKMPDNSSSANNNQAKTPTFAMVTTLLLFISLYVGVIKTAEVTKADLLDGARTTLTTQWGTKGLPVFDEIMRNNDPIWVASTYSYGALFGRTQLIEPAREKDVDEGSLSNDLLRSGARYIIYSETIPMHPFTDVLPSLIAHCPDAFELLLGPDNQKRFRLYKFEPSHLSIQYCQQTK